MVEEGIDRFCVVNMIPLHLDHEFRTYIKEIFFDPEYQTMKKYVAHGTYSVYDHCFRAALFAYSLAKEKGWKVDYSALVRGSLLHDYYLYDWHHTREGHRLHGFRHPYFALRNATKRYALTKRERNMILSHMFPVTFWIFPQYRESWILTYADKVAANRERKTRKKTALRKENAMVLTRKEA